MPAALFSDGHAVAARPVTLEFADDGLIFEGIGVVRQFWPYGALETVNRQAARFPLRVTSSVIPGARLDITDASAADRLTALAPQLLRKPGFPGAASAFRWVAGLVAAVALTGYIVLQFAPPYIAFMLPDSWRTSVGQRTEAEMTRGARACTGAAGRDALAIIAARLAAAEPGMPPLTITVYDIPVMNAFAMPGERIFLTSELIRRATRPEQVAGVLAHEVGHILKRHPEAGILRATGLQLLIGALTGGSNAGIASAAGLAAVLRYSRAAESEADAIALDLMTRSAIDTLALKEFFEILLKEEGKPSTGLWNSLGSALSTHPGTQERIDKIKPLPDGITAIPVLNDTQWQGLRTICN